MSLTSSPEFKRPAPVNGVVGEAMTVICQGITTTLSSCRKDLETLEEVSDDRPTLHVSVEELGGRTELRPSPHRPFVARYGAHASFVPAGVSAWRWSGPIMFHRRLTIHLHPASLPLALRSGLEGIGDEAVWMSQDPAILRCSELLVRALESARPSARFSSAMATAIVSSLSAKVERRRMGSESEGLAPWQLRKAQEFLAANLAVNVTMAEVAACVGLSESYFSRAFRLSTGVPPARWHLRLRIENAKCLILNDVPLAEVAALLGFADQCHLSRTFRSLTGWTPSEWRRNHR